MARFLQHINKILAGLFLSVVALFAAGQWHPSFLTASKVLLGGFIGGFTNSIAIKMLFERRWFLPGSGVLYKNRDRIIGSLASTAERHLLNTDLMKERIHEELHRISLRQARRGINQAIDNYRDGVVHLLSSDKAHNSVKRMIKSVARHSDIGFVPRLMMFLGIKDLQLDELTKQILSELKGLAAEFQVSNRMLRDVIKQSGTLEDFVFKPENPMLVEHTGFDGPLADYLLDHLEIRETVIRNLSKYSAKDITGIIEDNIREHLSWLEFFGIVLGALMVGLFELLMHLPLERITGLQ